MTRLTTNDISPIASQLAAYDSRLTAMTGRSLLGIACHAMGADEENIKKALSSFAVHVVPVTAGQGIISDFSKTVAAILSFLGFDASISSKPDVYGLSLAYEKKADGIMMADDYRFVGINLATRYVADNSELTGRVFASALELMAGGIKDKKTVVIGCGPVGESAARTLLDAGAQLVLYDIHTAASTGLKKRLGSGAGNTAVRVETDIASALSGRPYVLEATPSPAAISNDLAGGIKGVAAPGVPLGVSQTACKTLEGRLIHDKLELGVAAMAVALIT